jgi:hypothetical protein
MSERSPFMEMEKGGELDWQEILNKLLIPENAHMKTKYKDPLAMSMLEMFRALLATYQQVDDKGVHRLTSMIALLDSLIEKHSINLMSEDGWRADQIVKGVIGVSERDTTLSMKEKMFGEKKRLG